MAWCERRCRFFIFEVFFFGTAMDHHLCLPERLPGGAISLESQILRQITALGQRRTGGQSRTVDPAF